MESVVNSSHFARVYWNSQIIEYWLTGAKPKMPQSLSLSDIYDQLLFGNTLTLQFSSEAAAESFRVGIYKYKRRSSDQLEAVGIDFERQQLHFSAVILEPDHVVQVTMCLRNKPEPTKFTVVSIQKGTVDVPSSSTSAAEVSSDSSSTAS